MLALLLVESRYTFDGKIVGFGGARSEHNFFWICIDKFRYFLIRIEKISAHIVWIILYLIPLVPLLHSREFPSHKYGFESAGCRIFR